MKASVRHRYGGPEVLQLEEVETPSPADNEVLIKVYAASANLGDWEILTGRPRFIAIMAKLMGPKPRVDPISPPGSAGSTKTSLWKPKYKILGCDVAGRVEAVGSEVTRFQPGDEVFGMCGFGAFAEYVCLPEDSALAHKPAGISFEQAAALPQASSIALQGLRDLAPVQSGQRVLINGAGGGAGTLAVQLAKSMGAEVTAVDNGGKLDLMSSIGADHVLDYTREDFTLSGRYDLIFDLAAHRPLADCRKALLPNGLHLLAGGSMGPNLKAMAFSKLITRLSGSRVAFLMADSNVDDLLYMARLVEAGSILPIIDSEYSLDETPKALQLMGEGRALGKVIIKVT